MSLDNERLTDICDIADLEIERSVNRAIENARSEIKELTFTGECLYCNESIEEGRWCDTDCRDDWDYLESRKDINKRV